VEEEKVDGRVSESGVGGGEEIAVVGGALMDVAVLSYECLGEF
jgi:hypothetical protein